MKAKMDKYYIDTTLAEVALWQMQRKKIALTTGNLFWVMEKMLKTIEKKNAKKRIIKFGKNGCEYLDNK